MFRLRALAVSMVTVTAALVVPAPTQAAAATRTAISLSAPAAGVYGSTIVMRGRLWKYGTSTGLRGLTVLLQRKVHGKTTWANIRSTKTVMNGAFAFSVTQSSAFDYRAAYAGSRTYTRAFSPVRYPVTTQKVALDSVYTWDNVTGEVRANGRIWPTPPNGTAVAFQRWDGARWVGVGSGRTSAGRVTVAGKRPGSVAYYRLVVGGRYPYGAGVSPYRKHTHYVWRSAFDRALLLVNTSGGGGIYVLPRSEDPMRATMQVRGVANGYVVVQPDIAGCSTFGVASDLISGTGMTESLIYGDGVATDSQSFPPDGGVNQGSDLSHATQLFYRLRETSGASSWVAKSRLRLLCAN